MLCSTFRQYALDCFFCLLKNRLQCGGEAVLLVILHPILIILLMLVHIVVQLLIIFGVIITGYFSAKRNLWHTDMNRMMTRFVLNVSCPLLILASVMGKGVKFEVSELVQLSYMSVILYVVLLLCAHFFTVLLRIESHRRGLVRFVIAFGNVTFVGFPVVMALYGEKAVFYASVLTVPFNFLIFSLGVLFVKGEGRLRELLRRKVLFSPCIVASALAFAIAACGISVPEPVAVFCHLVGDMTIPCALLLVGSTLTCISLHDMMGGMLVYKAVILRLLAAPLVVMVVLVFVHCDPLIRNVAIVLSGMPSAANGIMFCLQYDRSSRDMAQCIFLSSLWSIATIPLLVYLIDVIYAGS